MTNENDAPAASGADLRKCRVITASSLAGFLAVTILICSQMATVEVVTVYSLASLLHLPATVLTVLSVLVAVPTLWLFFQVARLAFEAETAPENN
ncbi:MULTISPECIES: hypothetical protein [Nitratireductor]|uniref:hypothetical protein n=1 Tax=Nitratireductor TaxID=245876 RepID=UPI000D0D6FDC|nr:MULTISPECIES: hypothetical protein [Nitratireductor]PSM18036.1 hypothetical protein C7T96_13935 [Nitratireductor sp. StC3]